MANSLSRLPSGAESCSLSEWIGIRDSSADERLAAMHEKRDPVGQADFPGIEVACVCGFLTTKEPAALIYFWSQGLGVASYDTLSTKTLVRDLIELAVLLGPHAAQQSSFKGIKSIYEGVISGLFKSDPDFTEGKHLYWSSYGDITFCAFFNVSDITKTFSTATVLECLDFHYDYFMVKSPVWQRVPMSFLFSRVQTRADLVSKLLIEPRYFDPLSPAPADWFLWPWQRSVKSEKKSIQYTPIETTSLIFDLRKSTLALEHVRDENISYFSDFIKDVIACVKNVIFDHGGFFDKETGDGIVANFVDFHLGDVDIPCANTRAFHAARKIIAEVQPLCERFQERLDMGIGKLGGSVGIHTGRSVWICEDNIINAVGDSTILATRLCAEADSGAIFISNAEYQKLAKSVPEEMQEFRKHHFTGREYSPSASLFGYMKVERREES